MMSTGKVFCITGIDTDIGKSVVTGLLGRYLLGRGVNAITQKVCQTGCKGISEDILLHRKIMGMALTDEDRQGLTCPYVFSEPCSPHLAGSLENTVIEPQRISEATQKLAEHYDVVLLEGVGGLMVPLQVDLTLVDYLQSFSYHHFLVCSPRLGSINHTLAALEILQRREIRLQGLIYNRFEETSEIITADSREIIAHYLSKFGHRPKIADVFGHDPKDDTAIPDFSTLFDAVL